MNDLSPAAFQLLDLPRKERAASCMRDSWVDYPAAVRAKKAIKSMMTIPRSVYNPGMMLIGDFGAGKTSLVKQLTDESWAPGSSWPGRIVYVDMSEDTDQLNVQKRLIEEIAIRCGRAVRTVAQAQRAIREFNILAVVIDEFGETEEAVNVRRWKTNLLSIKGIAGPRWGLNIVLVGVEDFLDTVKNIKSLGTRFANFCIRLKPWQLNAEFAAFLKAYIREKPLKGISIVNSDHFLMTLVYLNQEASGKVSLVNLRSALYLFNSACRRSVLNEKECIDEADLVETYQEMSGVGVDLDKYNEWSASQFSK
ncbi:MULTISPECIES: TniB family NTP-binding protein [Pseudomonas]|nr:TniB family NTP-binding protein [Pseudomonas mosselii]